MARPIVYGLNHPHPLARRRWTIPLLLLAAGLLCAYVVPSALVLDRWAVQREELPAAGPWRVAALWNGHLVGIHTGGPGLAAVVFESDGRVLPAADIPQGDFGAFWLLLDLWTTGAAEELERVLAERGVALLRAGYARSRFSADGVAHVIGARGEGESELPQVWFARTPFAPCRVFLPGALPVDVAGSGPSGLPARLTIGPDIVVEILGPLTPVDSPPSFLTGGAGQLPPAEGPPTDWRKAFEQSVQ